jgi:hypothetical protein
MFEAKIQKAWEDYQKDMGLGRMLLWLAFYNLFLFFLSGFVFNGFQLLALYPVGVAFIFYFLRPKILLLDHKVLFALNIVPVGISVILNYYLIGEFDRAVGHLTRRDAIFSSFDEYLFGGPVSFLFEDMATSMGLLGNLLYDLMMLAYMSYFLLPIYGGILYFRMLDRENSYKVGRLFFSVLLYFGLNFILYLVIPVTGPQYWMRDIYLSPLPLTDFGHFLWGLVNNGQTTFIDCFPSGHTGIAFLVTMWLFRINHPHRFFLALTTLFIIMATLAMRYHYTLDLLCAFPLAYFCHRAAWFFIPVDIRPEHLRK